MTWIIPPLKGLIDPHCAPTYHIDDIGAIWFENGKATVYYYRKTPCIHGGEDQLITDVIIERQGIALVNSFTKIATFANAFMMMMGKDGQEPPPGNTPRGFAPHLVP